MKNKITFFIPNKSRSKELKQLLKSLDNQSLFPNQIIIVNNNDVLVKWILVD